MGTDRWRRREFPGLRKQVVHPDGLPAACRQFGLLRTNQCLLYTPKKMRSYREQRIEKITGTPHRFLMTHYRSRILRVL